jgi:hypothetical protein
MDCTDIVVGMARGDMSRVIDSYTRDRSDTHKEVNCRVIDSYARHRE